MKCVPKKFGSKSIVWAVLSKIYGPFCPWLSGSIELNIEGRIFCWPRQIFQRFQSFASSAAPEEPRGRKEKLERENPRKDSHDWKICFGRKKEKKAWRFHFLSDFALKSFFLTKIGKPLLRFQRISFLLFCSNFRDSKSFIFRGEKSGPSFLLLLHEPRGCLSIQFLFWKLFGAIKPLGQNRSFYALPVKISLLLIGEKSLSCLFSVSCSDVVWLTIFAI